MFYVPSDYVKRALKKVRHKIKRIVGLTGTPDPNGLLDIWSQVYLLDGGERLGRTFTGYRSRYFQPQKYINGGIPTDYTLNDDVANAAVLPNKLLQMANRTVYDEFSDVKQIHDKKLDALEDLIEAANGKPVLVYYGFKHDRDRIKKDLM